MLQVSEAARAVLNIIAGLPEVYLLRTSGNLRRSLQIMILLIPALMSLSVIAGFGINLLPAIAAKSIYFAVTGLTAALAIALAILFWRRGGV